MSDEKEVGPPWNCICCGAMNGPLRQVCAFCNPSAQKNPDLRLIHECKLPKYEESLETAEVQN